MVNYTLAFKRPFLNLKTLSIIIGIYFLANIISGSALILDPSPEFSSIKIIATILSTIISLIAIGYGALCAQTAMKNKLQLPKFQSLKQTTLLGVETAIIGLIYFIPLAAIIYLSGITVDLQLISTGATTFSEISTTLALIFIVGLLTVLLVPMAILHFLKTNNIKQAFNFKSILKKTFKIRYIISFIIALIYMVAINTILGVITLVTLHTIVIPWILSAISASLIIITTMTIYGLVFKELS